MFLVVTTTEQLTENGLGNLPPVLGHVESSPRSDGDRRRARRARQRGSHRADVRQGGRPCVVARLGREHHQVGRGGACSRGFSILCFMSEEIELFFSYFGVVCL